MSGKYATYQNGINKLEDKEEGEYFTTPDMGDLTANQFIEVAKAKGWVLTFQYKPEA